MQDFVHQPYEGCKLLLSTDLKIKRKPSQFVGKRKDAARPVDKSRLVTQGPVGNLRYAAQTSMLEGPESQAKPQLQNFRSKVQILHPEPAANTPPTPWTTPLCALVLGLACRINVQVFQDLRPGA